MAFLFCPYCGYAFCKCSPPNPHHQQTSADKPPVVTEPRSDVVAVAALKALASGWRKRVQEVRDEAVANGDPDYVLKCASACGGVEWCADELEELIYLSSEDK